MPLIGPPNPSISTPHIMLPYASVNDPSYVNTQMVKSWSKADSKWTSRLFSTVPQSIPTSTYTQLAFNNFSYNTYSQSSTTQYQALTANSFLVPSSGLYLVSASVAIAMTAGSGTGYSGQLYAYIGVMKSGSTAITLLSKGSQGDITCGDTTPESTVTEVEYFSKGDQIIAVAYQNFMNTSTLATYTVNTNGSSMTDRLVVRYLGKN